MDHCKAGEFIEIAFLVIQRNGEGWLRRIPLC